MAKRPVVLAWEGKDASLAAPVLPPPPLEIEETTPDALTVPATARNRIIRGDALDVARALTAEGLEGAADLVYLDPPYASGFDYTHEERFEGRADGRIARAPAYRDRWSGGPAAYLEMLLPRIHAMARLLRPTGSMWIQADWRAAYLIRSLCDEVFGRDRFLNEIVWRRAPNLGRQARSGQFGRTLDTLVVYGAGPKARLIPPERLVPVPERSARHDGVLDRWFTLAPRGDYTDASVAKLESQGRVHRSATGKVSIKYWLERDAGDRLCRRQPVDALWADIPPLRHAASGERTGYPTQKPRALLERVIAAGSSPRGLVIDLFAGSGTTAAAAMGLGRRFVVGDESAVAIATMRSRLLREKAPSLVVERCCDREEAPLARISAQKVPDGRLRIDLRCDGAEPVAWALNACTSTTAPFRVDWHAERGTGRRPAELPLTAFIAPAPVVRARVYFVEGAVAEAEARA